MKTNRRTFLMQTTVGAVGAIGIPSIIPPNVLGSAAPSNRINVAMIGCGRQTVNPNIPQLLSSKNAQIYAVCDLDAWRLDNAQKQVNDFYSKEKGTRYNGCKKYDDFRKLLLSKDVDAVMIATPDHWHVPVAIEAARAGKHISLEKPISTCIAHGQKLVEAVKKYKVITRNDSEFRSTPQFSRAIELVRSGTIGKIQRIFVAVPPESNGTALGPQADMPIPSELN